MKRIKNTIKSIHIISAASLFTVTFAICHSNAKAASDEAEPISTDRPDFVESSNVVGKGRFQIETGLAVDRFKQAPLNIRTTTTPTLLRLGVSDEWELRLETDGRTWLHSRDQTNQTNFSQRGYSDLAVGTKWHLQDQQEGIPSIGVLAHVDLPSGSAEFKGKGARPSLRVVYEWELPNDLSLGVEHGLLYDNTDQGKRFASGIFGITLAKSWTEQFRTFVEFAAPQITKTTYGGTLASLDVGAAYLLSNDIQLDTTVTRGLNRRTADWTWGIGISLRF